MNTNIKFSFILQQFFAPCILLALISLARAASAPNARDMEFFEAKVRPVLIEKCFSCHGDAKQKGGLRLDSREAILKGGDSGAAMVPGEAQKSLLIRAVHYDSDLKMPPAGKLSNENIAALTQWIQNGAAWPASEKAPTQEWSAEKRNFWSFQPVKKPLVPQVKNKSWARSPLDNFILAELEKRGLQPAPMADKRVLIRRATFDLIGLPPTQGEVENFLEDTSPNAYAKVVDRLLASPNYGERWARHWLDVARYADSLDSRGSGNDGDIAQAWRYRDWVVSAFNNDMPYDQFITQQIAGDILAQEKYDPQKVIATTLLAIGNWGNGDADKEKLQTDIADDQVDIVSRGFMGLTVACARCHDHKYDPISTKDYYGMAGIFFSTHILERMAEKGSGEAIQRVALIAPDELQKRGDLEKKRQAAEEKLKADTQNFYANYAKEMLSQTARYLMAIYDFRRDVLTADDFAAKHNLQPHALRQWLSYVGFGDYALMTMAQRDVLNSPGVHGFRGGEDTPSLLVNTNNEAHKISTFTIPAHGVNVHPGPKDGAAVTWKSPMDGEVTIHGSLADADGACGDGVAWAIDLRQHGISHEIASGDVPNGGAQSFPEALNATLQKGDSIEILVLPKASHICDSTTIDVTIASEGATWNLAHDIVGDLHENGKGNPHSDSYGNAAVWSFGDMKGTLRGKKIEGDSPLSRWQKTVDGPRQEAQNAADEFQKGFAVVDNSSPFWIHNQGDEIALPQEQRDSLQAQNIALEDLKKQPLPPFDYANAAQEGGIAGTPYEGFHDVRVHKRGSYTKLGDEVPRGFPAVLKYDATPTISKGSGRLELAEWIANEKHPLTARVLVNRLWQHHFGEGIVRTPSNFGFLGERPTHPQLLDYLASEFTQNGWSIKKMQREIMLSATYQQWSEAPPKTKMLDPDNRLFGHMNRQRLEAEAIRDSLLFVAGRLDLARGGPSVRDFKAPRRTLYITTIRSDRAGYGPLFDAADSNSSIDRRTVSVVAPQALFLMNDPFIIEQAQALAKRVEAVPDSKARVVELYQLLFSRAPSEAEIAIALKFLASPDKNSWPQYCQILLCSNEFVYRD